MKSLSMTTATIPPRYVVHKSTQGDGRWEVHEKGSRYCAVDNPGWTGEPDCGCLGMSVPGHLWSSAIATAHECATRSRLEFRDEMQARGKAFS